MNKAWGCVLLSSILVLPALIARPEAMDSTLVIHEAVHDILGANGIDQSRDGDRGHPLPYFDGRCTYRYHS